MTEIHGRIFLSDIFFKLAPLYKPQQTVFPVVPDEWPCHVAGYPGNPPVSGI